MILKNNLYKTENVNAADRKVTLRLLPDCIIYKVHFPEQPITPGVCIIQMATEVLSELLGRRLELDSVSNAKFLSVIDPRETERIDIWFKKLDENKDTGKLKASVTVSCEGRIFSKLSLTYSL